jgi:branched-chain amino acid aminotransferase
VSQLINFNGRILPGNALLVGADNRGLRYGEGLFETMRVRKGRIQWEGYHFDRLFGGLRLLGFAIPSEFTAGRLSTEIHSLCALNGGLQEARVRLTVVRGDGDIRDDAQARTEYFIQCRGLPAEAAEPAGLRIGYFPRGRKSADAYSSLKTTSYLLYTLALQHSKIEGFDECLILNSQDRICESATGNIFWLSGETLFTPPLSEGCVAGVARRYLLDQLPRLGYGLREEFLPPETLEAADEIFLTNAIHGIRPVEFLGHRQYPCRISLVLRKEMLGQIA